jgi:hypothetical protein
VSERLSYGLTLTETGLPKDPESLWQQDNEWTAGPGAPRPRVVDNRKLPGRIAGGFSLTANFDKC